MTIATKEYIAIPKVTWLKIQSSLTGDILDKDEKIELGFINYNELSEEQRNDLAEAKSLKESNENNNFLLDTKDNLILVEFLKTVFGDSLKKDGYKEEEIEDFAKSYLETYNTKNLINL